MKITCPECSAGFDVPVPLMGTGGRRVRCGNCGHVWTQQAVEPGRGFGSFRPDSDIDPIPASLHPLPHDDADDDEDAGPGLVARLTADIRWPVLGRMVAGFVLAMGLLLGVTAGLSAMHALPRFLMPVAAGIGMAHPVDAKGLEIMDVAATAAARGDETVTVVTGRIHNADAVEHIIPLIEITPISAHGDVGEGSRTKPEQDILKPGESVAFRAELTGPIVEGAQIRARFYPE